MKIKNDNMDKFAKIALLIALLFLIIYSSFPKNITDTRPMTTGTNKNIHFILTEELSNSGELFLELQHYYDLSENIRDALVPRDAFLHEGKVTLHGFLGTPFFYAIMIELFGSYYPYVTIIVSVLTGLALFMLSKEIFNSKIALISTIIYFTFPFIFFETVSNVLDLSILFLFFFFMGFYYFVRILKYDNIINYILCGIFFLISLLIRYDNIILLIPLFLLFIYEKKWKINVKGSFIVLLIAIIILIPLLSLNNYLYGDYFSIGYSTNPQKFVSSSTGSFFSEKSITHLSNYFVELYPIYSVLLALGIIAFLSDKPNDFSLPFKKIRLLFFYMMFVFLIKIFLHSGAALWGFEVIALNSSLIRYLSSMLILMFSFISYLIFKFSNKFVIVLMLLLIAYSGFNLAIYGDSGRVYSIYDDVNLMSQKIDFLNYIKNNTEENSIIIVSYNDKIIFPDRSVMLYQRINDETSEVFVKFVNAVSDISDLNIPLYIHRPSTKIINMAEVKDALRERGYKIVYIGSELYKFEKIIDNKTDNNSYIQDVFVFDWKKVVGW